MDCKNSFSPQLTRAFQEYWKAEHNGEISFEEAQIHLLQLSDFFLSALNLVVSQVEGGAREASPATA